MSISGHGADVNLTGDAQPKRLSYKHVTPNYFAVLGVDAQLGRTFDPHDATPGFNLEAVLSDGLWRREFGADPHIVGKALRLDNDVYYVVGVMPRGFRDLGSTREEWNTEVWLGAGMSGLPFPAPRRSLRQPDQVVARLAPGLSITAAQVRVDALVASLKKQYSAEYPAQTAWTVRLSPLSESVVGSVRQSLLLLFGAVGLVLLISCVNVANLLLARASGRGREIAVRQALGAQKTRLIRQFLTEILLLFMLGGVAGFAILFGAQHLLLRLIPDSLPHLNEIGVGWGVLVFAVAISVAAGTIFGLAPAWLMSGTDLVGTLRQEGRGLGGSRERSRARQILVTSELALSLVLMVAAGLLLRSFWDLFRVPPGFNPHRVMAIQTWLPGPNDPSQDPYRTATQEAILLREVLRRNRTLPGVEEVAIGDVAALPLGHSNPSQLPLIREGIETIDNQAPEIYSPIVSPEYFHLLSMPLLRGRLFNDQDLESTPQVAVINEAAARTYWPNQNPLGKRVRLHLDSRELLNSSGPAWTTIVGVIADARTESLAAAATPQIYRSLYQHPAKSLAIFLRGQLDPATILAQERSQVQAVDPGTSCLPCRDTGGCARHVAFGQAILDGTDRGLCGYCVIAGWSRNLRDNLLRGERTKTRDRHTSRAGSPKGQDPQDGLAPGTAAGRRRCRVGCGRCAHRLAPHGRSALRRVAERSTHLRWRHPCTYHCRARGQLHPRVACHATRSNHYTPLRMTCWRRSVCGSGSGHDLLRK